jgi:asparagine synthase (glutamine-hydrolysing)
MCGIAGILNFSRNEPVRPEVISGMMNAIRHRGPDGEGIYIDRNIGLGHRRLAIIDLSPAGHQPMATAEGSAWIVYNGEIYNYLELRAELAAKGPSLQIPKRHGSDSARLSRIRSGLRHAFQRHVCYCAVG